MEPFDWNDMDKQEGLDDRYIFASIINFLTNRRATVDDWLRSLTSTHLLLATLGANPTTGKYAIALQTVSGSTQVLPPPVNAGKSL